MASVDNIQQFLQEMTKTQGLITLWRPDDGKSSWFTANNSDPIFEVNKFAFFIVPYPLLWVDDSNNGKFHFGRQWKMMTMPVAIQDRAKVQNANKENEKITPTDDKYQTFPIWRQMQSNSELYCNLQTDPITWLPYCVIPADGSVGSYDRRVYFEPLSDNTMDL